jgi:hypothetical protein
MEMNSRFQLKIEYNPGKSNLVADLLSRSPALLEKDSSSPPNEFGFSCTNVINGCFYNIWVQI